MLKIMIPSASDQTDPEDVMLQSKEAVLEAMSGRALSEPKQDLCQDRVLLARASVDHNVSCEGLS